MSDGERIVGQASVTFIIQVPILERMYGEKVSATTEQVADSIAKHALIKAAKAFYENNESIVTAQANGDFVVSIHVED